MAANVRASTQSRNPARHPVRLQIASAGERPAPAYSSILSTARSLRGATVIAADGVARIDLRNDDGSILLGWRDSLVEAAVARTPSVSSSRLEAEAAERVGELIPCAEAVGFRSSVESALIDALVAAKTVTGRDGAYFCDDETTVTGDVETLRAAVDRHLGELAALVVRPMDASRDFLLAARRLSERAGVVLVFDETRTAFRVDLGGAQTLAGVIPDLTVIGASLANGRQISAVAGRLEPMKAMTATGDRVSATALAAACATLERVVRDDVPDVLRVRGAEIEAEIEARLIACGADAWLQIAGDPTWSIVAARARPRTDRAALEAALCAGLYAEGVISFGAHVPSLATTEAAISRIVGAYERVLPRLVARAEAGDFATASRRSALA